MTICFVRQPMRLSALAMWHRPPTGCEPEAGIGRDYRGLPLSMVLALARQSVDVHVEWVPCHESLVLHMAGDGV